MSADEPVEEPKRKRPMTLAEAGRRGGEKVKRERGRDYYAEIGRKGGASVKERRGPAFYAEIGRKGGEARRKDAANPEPEPLHERARDLDEDRGPKVDAPSRYARRDLGERGEL